MTNHQTILAGDKIKVYAFKDQAHNYRDINHPHHGMTYTVIDQDGVLGISGKIGDEWKFITLSDLDSSLLEIRRVNLLPIDLELEDFARLYAPPEGEEITPAEKLRRSLIRAYHASLAAADAKGDDGGTCNFDSPAIDFAAAGLKKAEAERVIHDAGMSCYDWKPFKSHCDGDGKLVKAPTYLVITGFQLGQGFLRTRMARAFCESLNNDGIESGMYYQMD